MTELEYWTSQIQKGRISRREFMGRAAALGVTTALATTILSQAGVAAEPKKGGSFKGGLAHGATTDTGDPAAYPDTATQVPFGGGMSSYLTEVDAKGNIVGDAAESFEPADKAATWVFKLRKGVTFHNGKDLTADDVIASYRHHMGKDSKSAVKSVLAPIKDIKADGKSTVIFTLDGGNADFPYLASDYHIPILPANADGSADWQSNNRTGAYTFVSWEPGVRAKLKRNPNYYISGAPYFDDVEFISITDVAARVNALTTGEVHWAMRPDLKTLDLLKRNTNIAINEVTGYGHYTFPMDTTVAPFNNADVRNALKWAINRDEILKKVFLGHGVVGNDNPIAPSVKFAYDPKPKFTYDPEKAKARAQRRLLRQRLAQEAVVCGLLERTADRGLDDERGLRQGRRLERDPLGQSQIQRPPGSGAQRDRREEAGDHVSGDAAARARRLRPDRDHLQQLCRGGLEEGRARPDRSKLGMRWPENCQAVVVRLA